MVKLVKRLKWVKRKTVYAGGDNWEKKGVEICWDRLTRKGRGPCHPPVMA
jgi:hypothetical protein